MAKKETEGKSQISSIVRIGRWVFLIGIIVAILASFIPIPYLTIILVIAGIIVGILNIQEAEVSSFLLACIAIIVVGSAGLQVLTAVGDYIINILKNIVTFVAPAALVVALKSFWVLARSS